jgi:protein-tyrosine phosphatase
MKRTADPSAERAKIQRAVRATVSAWRSGHGVVVHCYGGTGRTETVLGCVFRELGFRAAEKTDA